MFWKPSCFGDNFQPHMITIVQNILGYFILVLSNSIYSLLYCYKCGFSNWILGVRILHDTSTSVSFSIHSKSPYFKMPYSILHARSAGISIPVRVKAPRFSKLKQQHVAPQCCPVPSFHSVHAIACYSFSMLK